MLYRFIPNRKKSIIHDAISRRILPGSIISSDSWKVYINIEEILPEIHFLENKIVNPNDFEPHTQGVKDILVSI